MTLLLEAALFGGLCWNAYELHQIRKISRACYVELNTARWESGMRSIVAKEPQEGSATLRRKA